MSDVVIRVEKVSKKYRLGIIGHGSLSKDIQSKWARFRGKEDPNTKVDIISSHPNASGDQFWALREVSFEVKRGEIVGIIGKNGAGKSTLLKILSRVTAPSSGSIKVKGRVASLLEVGTGFHPELTGRENVFLNGAILGMRKREVEEKFDEIVAFAGVQKFIDTPVKRYSSGMYVRLAFAVAAHLEPEILVVDEVLAVGDAEFQKKCLGKMGEVAKEGRTVLFVSHNMAAITSLCTRSILMESGRNFLDGKTTDVIRHYLSNHIYTNNFLDFSLMDRTVGNEYVILLSGSIQSLNGELISEVDINDAFKVCMEFKILKETKRKFYPQVHFFASLTHVFAEYFPYPLELLPGQYHVEFLIPGNLLNDVTYFASLGMASIDLNINLDYYEENALTIKVIDLSEKTPGPRQAGYTGPLPGLIRPQFKWKIQNIS
jgi:lipopolysaccharide transport system ATP-binding protein